jgi:NTE family protein
MMTNGKDGGGLTAVVIAGAVARGAYEAAALTAILPRVLQNLESTIILGTSAGAINAVLWAQGASKGRPLTEVGAEVEAVWKTIHRNEVFGVLSADPVTTRLRGQSPHGLLNTSPLKKTTGRIMAPAKITANVESGAVRGVGVVATLCPQDGSGGRSRLFFTGPDAPTPPFDVGGSIDFVPTSALLPEHVLASAAVPVLFPAVEVTHPPDATGWYIDGGVRLNTPIKPAIDLGASRLIVVSSYAAEYPPAPKGAAEQPTVPDVAAQSIHALLGDGMIEDLRRLKQVNAQVAKGTAQSPSGTSYRSIPFMVVSPPNGALSTLALKTHDANKHFFSPDVFSVIDWVLPGTGEGNGELLSYLYFDPTYFEAQFVRARTDAHDAFAQDWRT